MATATTSEAPATSEDTAKFTTMSAVIYSGISIMIIVTLLLITELLRDATVMHTMWPLIVMAILVFVPFIALVMKNDDTKKTVSMVSVICTLIVAILAFYLRAKVSKFYIESGYTLTTDDLKTIVGATKPNGVVVLFNYSTGAKETGTEELVAEIDELHASDDAIKKLGLDAATDFTKESIEAITNWSKPVPRAIYQLTTTSPADVFSSFTVMGPKTEKPESTGFTGASETGTPGETIEEK